MARKSTLAAWILPSFTQIREFSRSSCLHIQFVKPLGYWNSLKNQRDFLEKVGKELNIKTLDDWYEKNVSDVTEKGGKS